MKLEMNIQQNKTAAVKGVKWIDAFDGQRFSLSTVQGEVHILGRELRMRKWDTEQGSIIIDGTIMAVCSSEWPESDRLIRSDESQEPEQKSWRHVIQKWFG